MKKLLLLLFIGCSIIIFGQNLSFGVLPAPGTYSSVYNNVTLERYLILGKKPSNFNGKTILFMHGFNSGNSVFLKDNTMYSKAYNAGYNTAFVSTTKHEGDYVNGEILSRAIAQVKNYFGANQIIIVAHSNGGRATEVAMFDYNQYNSVEKVVTLSTPFRGTQLADIASNPAVSWIIDAIGLNPGVSLSSTYYCDIYFRPHIDNNPNNQPSKFYNVGATGYNNWFTTNSAVAIAAGNAILLAGGGKNDGVTPFYSSTKPGGKQVLSSTDSRGVLNHFEIPNADKIWNNFLYPVLKGNYDNVPSATGKITSTNNEYKVSSNYQLITSREDYAVLSNKSNQYEIQILKENPDASFSVLDYNSKRKIQTTKDENGHILMNKSGSTNKVNVDGNGKFIALVNDFVDQPMTYIIKENNNQKYIELSFPNTDANLLNSINITAKTNFQNGLKGEAVESKVTTLNFKKEGNTFIADLKGYDVGVYSTTISAQIGDIYKRDLMSGFVITEKISNATSGITNSKKIEISNNPVNENSVLLFNGYKGNLSIKLVDATGRVVHSEVVNANGSSYSLNKLITNLNKGIYILEVSNGSDIKQGIKLIK